MHNVGAFIIRHGVAAGQAEQGVGKLGIGRILPSEAAIILDVSPQFVRIAMQQGKLPIGTAIKMSSVWTYHISGKLLHEYSGKDVEQEIEKIRKKGGE